MKLEVEVVVVLVDLVENDVDVVKIVVTVDVVDVAAVVVVVDVLRIGVVRVVCEEIPVAPTPTPPKGLDDTNMERIPPNTSNVRIEKRRALTFTREIS
jgi:hypothetical protein